MKKRISFFSLLVFTHPALAEGNIGGAVIPYFVIVIGILVGIYFLFKKAKSSSIKTTIQACYLFIAILSIVVILLIAPLFLIKL